MNLLADVEILQVSVEGSPQVCRKAVDFVGRLAAQAGASVFTTDGFSPVGQGFLALDKTPWYYANSVKDWVQEAENRYVVLANASDTGVDQVCSDFSLVEITAESWQTEETLFAQCGLADLLGERDGAPLVPDGPYAAASIGFAGLAALTGVIAKRQRFGLVERAQVQALAALGWINWKAAAAASMGDELHREGRQAEWPILPCADGYVALVFTERDWPSIARMIGDQRLEDERFTTFQGRQQHRDDYMGIIRDWVATRTKEELNQLFYDNAIPAGPAATVADLLDDDLLNFREAFESREVGGVGGRVPIAPHRIEKVIPAGDSQSILGASPEARPLPLAGLRVLDLGIITAGAGTSGLLADMGAEVLKIESEVYPDPFRLWAGSDDSPLFNFNNRNKYGVGIDLKTAEGKEQLFKLVETSDAIVENFRRGVLDRLGFTLEALRERNPNILVASVSGLGLEGIGSDHTTFGSTLEALSGFAAQTCSEEGLPYITGRNVNYPDQTVCFYAAALISMGMLSCRRENCAMHIDIAQRDVAMYILGEKFASVSSGVATDVRPGGAGMFCSADQRWVTLDADNHALSQLLGGGDVTKKRIEEWVAGQTATAVVQHCLKAGVSAARVDYGSEMMVNPVVEEAGVFTGCPGGTLVKGFPFRYAYSEMTVWGDAPHIGEHSEKFL